ncbi:MAG: hypothetical protein C0402_06165 [Thermodesulfovibrio sp.]|nr:hypothetical protein [Thermodesulfovibrio sp.]
MDASSKLAIVIGLFSLTTMINLLFGFLRNRTRKYSINWFLCIHAPIPFIFLARIFSHLGLDFIPLFVLAALAGQILGGKIEF